LVVVLGLVPPNQFQDPLGHRLDRLAHRGELRVRQGSDADAVEADDAEVLGHAVAEGLQPAEKTQRDDVGGGDEGAPRHAGQHLVGRLQAPTGVKRAAQHRSVGEVAAEAVET
jgi:hypothetical protein